MHFMLAGVLTFFAVNCLANNVRFPGNDPLGKINTLSAPTSNQKATDVISNGVTTFSLNIEKQLLQTHKSSFDNQYIVFSPVCITVALAMLLLGASGQTYEELLAALGLNTTIGLDPAISSQLLHQEFGQLLDNLDSRHEHVPHESETLTANAIFVQSDYPIREEYRESVARTYRSDIINVNFARDAENAQNTINKWVSAKTGDRIDGIISAPPSASTKLIITSALYFNGEWEQPFQLYDRVSFYPNGRENVSKIKVDIMWNVGTYMYYKDPVLDCQIIGIPYKGNSTVMYVILPKDSNHDKLRTLENHLTAFHIDRLLSNMQMNKAIILMPKMALSSTISLRDPLMHLGIRSLFNPSTADLSLISPGEKVSTSNKFNPPVLPEPVVAAPAAPPAPVPAPNHPTTEAPFIFSRFGGNNIPGLYADEVLHKVVIDVSEMGTEAAAATSVTLAKTGERAGMRLDVPFLFFIRQTDLRLNLFWGSVTTPTPNYV